MKLLYTINSPYARKVRIVAAEKHIDLTLEEVVLAAPDCPVKQYNPLGKVPVLVLPDGDSLYDSRVIVEYLDNRTPLAHLIPQDHGAKIKVRRWEALADGVCDAAVATMLEQRKSAERQDTVNIERQMDKVRRGLQVLNDEFGKSKNTGKNNWCVNGTFSLADIAVGCMLGYINLRFGAVINLAGEYPNLERLNVALLKRQSFKDSLPVA
ncbi:MAG: glutathione S-transferase N-terminal domain-containing protein [Methylotenera sp.]|uniref:glutathione S-transferase N-terminal domain-containing protein n=1 Tax=Methylotenera sp. TaxID=2051956 RepID=UPI002726482C|nr:glutathione S-transferase N-terminal domain-containing protein [Methylotenera sp.]MDO9393314.1 glutathione S-transferase N-terminal domain-containing protein [Methylotenera sp.]MDP1521728.1 glutathione S-transferase N-terminal domain-containing protein [Methylotenera sp.]